MSCMLCGIQSPWTFENFQHTVGPGADPKLPSGRPHGLGSPAAMLQSLVLQAIEKAANGATYPHLLTHRLVLAEEICAMGRPEVGLSTANQHHLLCEAYFSIVHRKLLPSASHYHFFSS